MSLNFTAYVAIDDDTPDGLTPFTNNPSVWSMDEDYGLSLCGEYGFFYALGYSHRGYVASGLAPLIPLRDNPDFLADSSDARRSLEGEDIVGWLDSEELFAALQHQALTVEDLTRPVQTLLGTVKYLSSVYGEKRVRMIFAFID